MNLPEFLSDNFQIHSAIIIMDRHILFPCIEVNFDHPIIVNKIQYSILRKINRAPTKID